MQLGSAFRPPMVGLDIGSSAVKAVVLRRGRGGWALVNAGEMPVPDAAPRPGGIVEPTAVSETIGGLLDSLRLKRARIASALAGHAVIVKRLSMPAMTQAELNAAIPWEAEQYIPFDLSEIQLDYQVVGAQGSAARNAIDVLLVAARKDRIEDRTAVISRTGRRPVVLDIEAFALTNAYTMNYPERQDGLTALVHVGQRMTIVCILENGEPAFTRDVSIGGKVHLDALLREFGPGGLDALAARRILHGQLPPEISADQVSTVLRDASAALVLEIRKTIDFYRATAPIEHLDRIIVSGGASQAVGLVDLLNGEFDAAVEIMDPFRRITRSGRAASNEAAGPAYAVAVGLALRQEGDR